MATARHIHLYDNPSQNIDVYTSTVVVYEGQTFDWTISGQDGQASVTVEQVPGQSWPFTVSSFAVSRGNGTPATVPTGTAGNYQFQCSPAAPTSPQTLVVATVYGICGDPTGVAGSWFAWQNNQGGAIVIRAVSGNLPFPGSPSQVVIPANSTNVFQIATNAALGEYPLNPTFQQNGSGCCPQAGEPKIVVGTNLPR
jgi:hypothetical protein